ncbi:hypothetical protein FIU87_02620 [Bacillus sp. THAF10]|uniref:hypothetical protein n=1 Tax=Bacillus sp. THAF10 TaxID=2587848 RepID=UPI001268BA90|nr:hypothetical protein [Bacillus sp. THAF10]QFT87534.1 hypothetical protein FIU87_02620 [Bacillus sp. THAF10]
MIKMKRGWIGGGVVLLLIVIAILTNPTLADYEGEKGELLEGEVEHINFYVFSTYTPVVHHEHGITHLGIFGKFYQMSDGQFD